MSAAEPYSADEAVNRRPVLRILLWTVSVVTGALILMVMVAVFFGGESIGRAETSTNAGITSVSFAQVNARRMTAALPAGETGARATASSPSRP